MLLFHDDILSAIDRLLFGACDDRVLRPCPDNYLLCPRDHGLLCSGADHDVLRADNRLLYRARHVHKLLPRNVHLRLSDYLLRVLSALAVVGRILLETSAPTFSSRNLVFQKTV